MIGGFGMPLEVLSCGKHNRLDCPETIVKLPLLSVKIEEWPFSLLGIAYGQGKRLQLEIVCSDHSGTLKRDAVAISLESSAKWPGCPLLVIVNT